MDDVKAMKRGKQAEVDDRSNELATRKIDELLGAEEARVEEEGASSNEKLMNDAYKVIEELQQVPNPDEVMAQLDPVMQNAVMSILGGTEQPATDGSQESTPDSSQDLSFNR